MKKKVISSDTESLAVLIANPMYDEVFNYLIEDNEAALKFISAIIGEKIVKLEKKNTLRAEKIWNISYLDFAVQIKTDAGLKFVMIEIQKVYFHTDIIAFKKYFGYQHHNMDNIYVDSENKVHVMPVYYIFIIGDGIGIKNVPVIIKNPVPINARTGEKLDVKNEFIESLNNNSWIIQVPELDDHHNDKRESLLSIFDQTNRMEDSHRILNLEEKHFPKEYRPVICRLQQAAAIRKIRRAMETEDYLTGHFRILEREIVHSHTKKKQQ
jgi:hypothetical protein